MQRRATPKAKAALGARPKLAPAPPTPEGVSDEEESPHSQMSRSGLETAILEFLVSRNAQQQERRQQLWSRLAGL